MLDLEAAGHEVYIPPKKKDYNNKSISRKHFTIKMKESKPYLECSNGKILKGNGPYPHPKGHTYYTFQIQSTQCRGCPWHHECHKKSNSSRKTVNFKTLELFHKDKIENYLHKMNSPEGRKEYNRRLGKEHVFANFKLQKHHGRTYYRGHKKVELDLILGAIAHNLGKYIKFKQRTA